MLSTFKLVYFLSMEICLESINLIKDFLLLSFDILDNSFVDNSLVSVELSGIDMLHVVLALLEACSNLIGKPSGDWSSSSGSWILSVVDNILFHHTPMLMSESEC